MSEIVNHLGVFLGLLLVGGFDAIGHAAPSDPATSTSTSASFKELTDYALSYRDAAEAGDAQAQYNLGAAYRWGVGVPQNLELGVHWIRQSAEHGYAPAQRVLGSLFEKGEGVPKSDIAAYRWYRRAARQGDQLAEEALPALKARLPSEELIHPSKP